jgi:ankyrin repeat protein
MALFLSEEKFRNWTSLHDLDEKFCWVKGSSPETMGAQIYYAVLTRLFKLVGQLVEFNAATGTQTEVHSINLPVNSTDTEVPVAPQWPSTGEYINAKGGSLLTALLAASWLVQEDIVNLLIEKGADPNIYGGERARSALSIAAKSGSKNIVELLLNSGADVHEGFGLDLVGSTELIGTEDHSTQSLQPLPSKEVHKVAEKDGSRTISQRASAAENGEIAITTIVKAVDLWADNKRQRSALFEASTCGHVDIVKLLLEKGAMMDRRNWINGEPALLLASCNGPEQVVRVLLENGADGDKTDVSGNSPLCEASLWGHEQIIDLLLKHGASLDKANKIGHTPLCRASLGGYEQIVDLLLKHGAKVDGIGTGCTPLQPASRIGYKQIVDLLLKHGANVDKPDWYNCTPLYEASREGHEIIVDLLLKHGVSVDKPDRYDCTPLYEASRKGHEIIVNLLLKHGASANEGAPL